jgi:internalin A
MTKDELLEVIKNAVASYAERKMLYLSNKNLIWLPPEIGQLTEFVWLDLHGNRLMKLPAEIGRLTNLTGLSLRDNQLTELPLEIGRLINLTWLDLSNNRLTSLPPEISQLTNLNELYLSGNPLPIPPEIISKANEPSAIINYYLRHTTGQKKPLNEAKVLVVGQSSVGKTSLVNRLTEGGFNSHEPKTEGINIRRWQVEINDQVVRLNMWDFGGQEIMHATHQFFLTKRSLYLLVVDARLGEAENRIEYWLKIIQSFGKESPVIIVGNKIDQQGLDLDKRGLQAKYSNIKTFVEISCLTGMGIDELTAAITQEVGALEHIHDELLANWFTVKERLEQMEEDYIPFNDYLRLCKEENINDDVSQNTLIDFLHDLGLILHYHDDPRMEETNILNPSWVTNGVYTILNSHMLFQNKGMLERKWLGQILDPQKYPRDKHLFIMDIMRKFELCFDFMDFPDQRFLVPDLLTREEPDTGEWIGALAFQLHYNVLPSSIISRFIVRTQQYLNKNTLWRTGVVLKNDEENRALVKADLEDKKIFIWVDGPEKSRRRFLEVIRSNFYTIHKTIPGIVVDEKVPLPWHPEITVDFTHLLRLEVKSITDWIPEGLAEAVNVKQLLNGIESEQARQERRNNQLGEEMLERLPRTHPPVRAAIAALEPAESRALEELTRMKAKYDKDSERYARKCLLTYLALQVMVGAVLAVLIYRIGWDTLEPWTYLIGIITLIGTYGYFVFTQRELSPSIIYEHLIERKKTRNYAEAGFNLENYEQLMSQLSEKK